MSVRADGKHACGDVGGVNATTGEPCGRNTKPGERCHFHPYAPGEAPPREDAPTPPRRGHWICGDSGGENAKGAPCGRRVGGEGERCPQHPESGEKPGWGRPRREFTPDDVRRVEQLAGFGLTQEEIAAVLDVGEVTLNQRLQEHGTELTEAYARGRATMKARASARYHQIAFNRGQALGLAEGKNVPISEQRRALRHILESGGQYRRVERREHVGADGGPIKQEVTKKEAVDPSTLEQDDLDALEVLLDRATISLN